MKNLVRKRKEQIKGRPNRRRPFCNSTIQLVVVNLYTKYEVSIFNGCGDIFDKISGKKEKGTNVTHKAVRLGARPHVPPVMAEGDFRLMTPLYDNLQ